jgi:hypothetical protein
MKKADFQSGISNVMPEVVGSAKSVTDTQPIDRHEFISQHPAQLVPAGDSSHIYRATSQTQTAKLFYGRVFAIGSSRGLVRNRRAASWWKINKTIEIFAKTAEIEFSNGI